MSIDKLSHEEKLGLVALLELVAMSDGTVSDGEIEQINLLVKQLGDDEYRSLLDEADNRFADVDDLKEFLKSFDRRDSQETIFGFVMEEAQKSPTVTNRHEIVDWLALTWDIAMRELENEE